MKELFINHKMYHPVYLFGYRKIFHTMVTTYLYSFLDLLLSIIQLINY